jgi:CheY-like chemotaxis protein
MGGPKVLLVADDSPLIRDLLQSAARNDEILVLSASDGEEAIALAKERHPDGIVMDLLMPKLDGLSALLRLRTDPATRDIPVLMVSGQPMRDLPDLAGAYGVERFLEKPFGWHAFMAAVRSLLRLDEAKVA